jgi:hypothetical protein
MTIHSVTPDPASTNHKTRPSIAEQRAQAYRAEAIPPARPLAAPRPSLKARVLPWLAAGVLAAGVIGAAYALTPTVPSVAVRQVFVDLDGNGALDLLLYGEVILNSGPLSPGAGR